MGFDNLGEHPVQLVCERLAPVAGKHRPGRDSDERDHVDDDGGERGHHEHAQHDAQQLDHVFMVALPPAGRNP